MPTCSTTIWTSWHQLDVVARTAREFLGLFAD